MKPLPFIILFLFLSILGYADEQRLQTKFISKNKEYIIEYKRGGKWYLKNRAGKTLYKIRDKHFTSMTMYVSNDGRNVIAFNDFKEGHEIAGETALWFYTAGELQKQYKFTDLLDDTCNVMKSIWHTTWTFDQQLLNKEKQFIFSTYEFYDYTFDIESGEMIKKERLDFDDQTVIVYGSFKIGTSPETTMNIKKYIAGNKLPGNKLTFKTTRFGPGNWNRALMIRNGVDITPPRFIQQFLGYSCLTE